MRRAVKAIECLVATIGKGVGWLHLVLIAIVVIDVSLRWTFSLTAAWVGELEWHLFSIIFLLGIPYALQKDRHVRVDLFYERFPDRDRLRIDRWGTLLFLLPWATVVLIMSSRYAYQSLLAGEGSPNPNGIPLFFPIKAMVPLAALLLLVQGLAILYRSYRPSQEGR